MATRYFTFEVNGRRTGLIRRTETRELLTFERMDTCGRWVDDPGLVRHFRDSVDLVAVDSPEASRLAALSSGSI